MDEFCRCDWAPMNGSDHCPECSCEEFEQACTDEQARDTMERMGRGEGEFTTAEEFTAAVFAHFAAMFARGAYADWTTG